MTTTDVAHEEASGAVLDSAAPDRAAPGVAPRPRPRARSRRAPTTRDEGSRRRRRVALGVAVLLVVAAAAHLLLRDLTVTSPSIDEPVYVDAARALIDGEPDPNVQHPPLAKQLISLGLGLVGDDRLGARLPGVVLAALAGLAAAAAGRGLGRAATGVTAAALVLLLPLHPGTTEVRVERYATLEPAALALGAGALACAVAAVRLRRGGGPELLMLGAALAGLAVATKASAAVALAAPLVAAVVLGGRPLVRAARAAAVSVTALAAHSVVGIVSGEGLVGPLRRSVELQLAHVDAEHPQLVAGQVYDVPPWWAPWWFQAQYLGWPALVALWLAAAVGVGVLLRDHRRPGRRAGGRTAAGAPVAAVLAAAVAAVVASPLKLPHYHLLWVVPLCVLAAHGLVRLATTDGARDPRTWAARAGAVALVAPLAVAALGVQQAVTDVDPGEYDLLAGALADADADPGPLAVWGYPALTAASTDRPVLHVLEVDPAGPRPPVVVVDPLLADRQRDGPAAPAARRLAAGCERVDVDRLQVYVCG